MQEQSIFTEAVEKEDPAERAAFLNRVCAGDPALRQRIDRLLLRHRQGDNFLDSPVPARAGTVNEPSRSEGPGILIGPYKLLQQIGEGGMGTVYMAARARTLYRGSQPPGQAQK
jgi:eukaryotic-like serine/threonine-protein kinase